jgi:tRNA threonylcarbamoyladenosine biosynthesis protein TsaB
MMNILALDSAAPVLSIALSSPGGNFYFEADAGQRHSELLLEEAKRLLEKAALVPEDLSLLACMGGPGSFTGLRIGFAACKGMALALGKPFVSVPTLDCMALAREFWPGAVLPVIDAKKQRFFTALYRQGGRRSPYIDGSIPAILEILRAGEQILVSGPDAALFMERLEAYPKRELFCLSVDGNFRQGYARYLLELARKKYSIQGRGDDDEAGPEYLRKSDAELALEEKLERSRGGRGP